MAPPHELMPKWGVVVTSKEKTATSKLRGLFRLVPKVEGVTATGKPEIQWKALLGSEEVGGLYTTGKRVSWAFIDDKFRGMGLGKKMYGEVLRRMPKQQMSSDTSTSEAARRVWSGMESRPGYKVKKPKLLGRPVFKLEDQHSSIGSQFKAKLPAKSAITVPGLKRDISKARKEELGEALETMTGLSPKKLKAFFSRRAGKEKVANDPVKEKLTLHGIPLSLEWREGETRKYFNHDPLKKKSVGTIDYNKKMKADYGYVRGVMDADGEELDVYLGPNRESEKVFVLEKLREADQSFDENKIMLGYDSMAEAKKSYLQHQGKNEMGKVRELTLAQFKSEFMSKKKTAGDKAENVAIAGFGASPFIGLLGQKKLLHDPVRNKSIPKVPLEKLQELAQPGDLIISSSGTRGLWETPQRAISGSGLHHVEPVVGRKGNAGTVIAPGRQLFGRKESNEVLRKELKTVVEQFDNLGLKEAVLLRPKNLTPAQRTEFADEVLTRSRGMFDNSRAATSYLRDIFVPKTNLGRKDKVPKVTEGKPPRGWKKGGDKVLLVDDLICSTAASTAYKEMTGKKILEGKRSIDYLPHDYLKSDKFDAIAATLKKGHMARRIQPYLTRAGIGAVLAGGAYYAIKGTGFEKNALIAPMPGNVLSNSNSLLPDPSELSRGAHIQAGKRMRGPGEKDPFDFGMKKTLDKKRMYREIDSPLLRSGGGKKLRLDTKVASVQMLSFFGELEKTGGDYSSMATLGAIIGGVKGGVKGAEPDSEGKKHTVKGFAKGTIAGAGLGVLIMAALNRNSEGKSTIPTPEEMRKSSLSKIPSALRSALRRVV